MNVLIIGSGGREHALAWRISQSPFCEKLFAAPGNAGIAEVANLVQLDASNHAAVIGFCRENDIGLVVIGPEAPLVAGLSDDLAAAGIKHFGPSKAAAQLEGSKGFTKDFCREFAIPTGAYGRFNDASAAKAYLAGQPLPIVIKADGLAAGKGVVIAATETEAEAAVDACFEGAFGDAGHEVVIEAYLEGEEASFFALCDGAHAIAFGAAQDHKRVGDGDTGPNTGGMGAYTPAPVMTDAMMQRTMDEIIHPTLAGMTMRGIPFKGVLFAGLMITDTGPQLIEYNVRFGDPECQVLLMRLKSDLLPALIATAEGTLDKITLDWYDDAVLTVVMAAKGYPGTPEKGSEIRGLQKPASNPGVEIFHAGTKRNETGHVIANGGRVLNVTARGANVAEAQARAYAAVDAIEWPEGFCRRDIGWRAVTRENENP
ncbi:MAG: phosphoribosylamine--glycine ligase [Hyphomicrobiaceae bacterium]|nr:phosphoribosylamine--glycine ligase [Hyphomicrobiaceae bacterium]MCC0011060.1 phosphoribosylamine--glycine ligase [Hyphomicrobiaceae bacterium]